MSVAFVPRLLSENVTDHGVCAVIDVLRATTTLTTLLSQGAIEVTLAASANQARLLKHQDPAALLLGEIDGLRPADFDLGNSPAEMTPDRVAGRRAICATSNGTAAIRAVAHAPRVMLACVRNSTAVAEALFQAGRPDQHPITIVCAGGDGGKRFALDDTLTAGLLIERFLMIANRAEMPVQLNDSSAAALALYRTQIGSLPSADDWSAALRRTDAGQHLARIGLDDDIPFCSQPDQTDQVPHIQVVEEAVIAVPGAPVKAQSPSFAAIAVGDCTDRVHRTVR